MGGLFKPKIVRWTKDGKRCRAGTAGATRTEARSPTWWGTWVDPQTGREQRKALSTNKAEAQQLLGEIEAANQRCRLGLPALARALDRRPLLDHLAEYVTYLEAEGDCPGHVAGVRQRCTRLLELLQWRELVDIRPLGVLEALAAWRQDAAADLPPGRSTFTTREVALLLDIQQKSVRALVHRRTLKPAGSAGPSMLFARADVAELLRRRSRGLGIQTTNHYLHNLKAFTAWLTSRDTLPLDPLARLRGLNVATDTRRRRRALPPEQMAQLLTAARRSGPEFGLTGPDRAMLYLLASSTGFRAHELSSLTPESFGVDKPPYGVTLEARFAKNRTAALQPLQAAVAEVVRSWLKGRPAELPLWPGTWWRKGAIILRRDLERAGIPFREAGRNFDFHALRGQYLTTIAAAGLHPKIAQELGRLSSIELVMRHYTDAGALDLRAALEKLPPPARLDDQEAA